MADFAATIRSTLSVQHNLPAGNDRITAVSVPYTGPTMDRVYSSDTASGTGARGARRFIQESGSLVSTTLDIDLTTWVASDNVAGMAHFREIWVDNTSATDALTVGLGTNPVTSLFLGGTSPTITVEPGARMCIACKLLGTTGYVVDSTHKILRLNSGSATVAYRVLIIGD